MSAVGILSSITSTITWILLCLRYNPVLRSCGSCFDLPVQRRLSGNRPTLPSRSIIGRDYHRIIDMEGGATTRSRRRLISVECSPQPGIREMRGFSFRFGDGLHHSAPLSVLFRHRPWSLKPMPCIAFVVHLVWFPNVRALYTVSLFFF